MAYAPKWLRANVSTAAQWSPAHAAESTLCASGDESSIQQAVLKGSHKKLQWILECLLGNRQSSEFQTCFLSCKSVFGTVQLQSFSGVPRSSCNAGGHATWGIKTCTIVLLVQYLTILSLETLALHNPESKAVALAAIYRGHGAPCHQNCLLHAGGDFIKTKLVFDFYGNYTLQDLIEATKRLRDTVRGLEKNGQLTSNQAKKALGMKDGRHDYLGMDISLFSNIAGGIIGNTCSER